MKFDYYFSLVHGLISTSNLTVDLLDNCCPTYHLDGTPCSPQQNRSNITCMFIDDFIRPCLFLEGFTF